VTLQHSRRAHSNSHQPTVHECCCACIRNLPEPSHLSVITNMARYAPGLNAMVDLTSFLSEERFSYSSDGGFRVAIPRITGWDHHPRAKISELKEYLLADLKLTRGGRLSQYQPERPAEQDYRYLRYTSKTTTPYLSLFFIVGGWVSSYIMDLNYSSQRTRPSLL
jgi:hypothetical protein